VLTFLQSAVQFVFSFSKFRSSKVMFVARPELLWLTGLQIKNFLIWF